MKTRTKTFRILRFKPGRLDPPRYQDFEVPWEAQMTVLDGLERIRLTMDASLMYRHCCHHASCGTCACTINGTPALACTARIADLPDETITLAPLAYFTCLGDLAVDMSSFFDDMDPQWANLRPCERVTAGRTPQGVKQLMRLENCIECGCCVAACPESSSVKGFMGPAALAAVNNEIRNRPQSKAALLRKASHPRAATMCRRHLACSRVCPTQVYPARHIADLLRAISGLSPPDESKN